MFTPSDISNLLNGSSILDMMFLRFYVIEILVPLAILHNIRNIGKCKQAGPD